MGTAFSPIRAKTHFQYAKKLMEEAVEADRLGHAGECIQKCADVADHAIKAMFNISAVDSERYRSMEEAVAKGLRDVFDKEAHSKIQSCYKALMAQDSGQIDSARSIEMASFLIGKAADLLG